MGKSVLDEIALGVGTSHLSDYWSNGKVGSVSDFKGDYVFRFREAKAYDNGNYHWLSNDIEQYPIVAVGIVAFWLKHRTCNNRLSQLFAPKLPELGIREQFDHYTQLRYDQFKKIHKDNPDAWKWNWDYKFYSEYIIAHEMGLNKQAEALLEFITDDDQKEVRSVMSNYIEYLKMRRLELGFEPNNELKVLRSIANSDDCQLEDVDDEELCRIFDMLEAEGFIQVAWCEGHKTFDDVRLLAKGKVYMKQLEDELMAGASKQKLLAEETGTNSNPFDVLMRSWDDSLDAVFDSRINPVKVFLELKDENRPKFKSPYSRFFVFYKVLEYMHWVTGTQTEFLKWVNLHWQCGWSKSNHFKFSGHIPIELRDTPLSDWYAHIVPNSDIGLDYRLLAERLFTLLTSSTVKGERWLKDKTDFYKEGETDFINNGFLKHPYLSAE